MLATSLDLDFRNAISTRTKRLWRFVQVVVWLVGVAILCCLFFFPSIGILLFWDILIPIAPALFVVCIGIWRNICPLATTVLLPRHLGFSQRKKLSTHQQGTFSLFGVLLLYILVPLRHALFNNSGIATGMLITGLVIMGIVVSSVYDWKSAWCSGLCPVHAVEKLYGANTIAPMPNMHCQQCANCVVPCPDSTPNMHPKSSLKTNCHQISGWLIIGGLPGFIWGWFNEADMNTINTWQKVAAAYKLPIIGMLITLILYTVFTKLLPKKYHKKLIGMFAALSVSCYYWFRLPALFGFGRFASDGLLINLTHLLPAWALPILTTITTLFFFYWLVVRVSNKKSWLVRPRLVQRQHYPTK